SPWKAQTDATPRDIHHLGPRPAPAATPALAPRPASAPRTAPARPLHRLVDLSRLRHPPIRIPSRTGRVIAQAVVRGTRLPYHTFFITFVVPSCRLTLALALLGWCDRDDLLAWSPGSAEPREGLGCLVKREDGRDGRRKLAIGEHGQQGGEVVAIPVGVAAAELLDAVQRGRLPAGA